MAQASLQIARSHLGRSASRHLDIMEFYAGSRYGQMHIIRGHFMEFAVDGWLAPSTWAKVRSSCRFFGDPREKINQKFLQARDQWISWWSPAFPFLAAEERVEAHLWISNATQAEEFRIFEFLREFGDRAYVLWKF